MTHGLGRPQVIAHRGASGQAPENTLAAFRRALDLGVDAVELDAHLSADGHPVVVHDFTLERTTNGAGSVGAQMLADLRRLDAGRWFGAAFAAERIPTLAEALDVLRDVRVIVELKSGPVHYPEITRAVVGVARESRHPRVTISSFDHPLLLEVKTAAPEIPTAVLFSARPVDPVGLARDAGAKILHPQWAFVDAGLVRDAHAAGLRVEAWTVDDPAATQQLIAAGVDGIMTNYPERLIALLDQGRAR